MVWLIGVGVLALLWIINSRFNELEGEIRVLRTLVHTGGVDYGIR